MAPRKVLSLPGQRTSVLDDIKETKPFTPVPSGGIPDNTPEVPERPTAAKGSDELVREQSGARFIREREKIASLLGGSREAQRAASEFIAKRTEAGVSDEMVSLGAAQAAEQARQNILSQVEGSATEKTGLNAPMTNLDASANPSTLGQSLGNGLTVAAVAISALTLLASKGSSLAGSASLLSSRGGKAALTAGGTAGVFSKLTSQSEGILTASETSMKDLIDAVNNGAPPEDAFAIFQSYQNTINKAEGTVKMMNANSVIGYLSGGKDAAIKFQNFQTVLAPQYRMAFADAMVNAQRNKFIQENPAV